VSPLEISAGFALFVFVIGILKRGGA